jgi:DNA polymerase-3 subunit delta
MKLAWKDVEPFVKKPDAKARAILVYGPDNGLMKERARVMGKTVVADLNDPFNVVVLDADTLIDDPARLSDEARAMSMMGGARLIRIENGSDKISPALREYLEDPSLENLIIIEAGELGPKSPLRALFEKSGNAAAVPCYVEDERGLSTIIRQMLSESGYTAQADAMAWLATNVAGDRARARSEIEKLILYMGGTGGTITIADAMAACGEAGTADLDELVYAVAGAKREIALATFLKLLDEGVAVVTILRTLQNHFRKLHYTQAAIAQGASVETAMKALQPPIFFKLEQPFRAQLQRWTLPRLQSVMARLSDLEAQTKKTGTPVETLCAQAVLSISAA